MLHTQYSRMTDLSEILTQINNFLEDISKSDTEIFTA